MQCVFAKIRERGKSDKYRRVLSTEEEIYRPRTDLIQGVYPYTAGASLQSEEWFKLEGFSKSDFAIDLIRNDYESVDHEQLQKNEFTRIDFLFVEIQNTIFFQKANRARLMRKCLWKFGDKYQYLNDTEFVAINEYPDAIYVKDEDALYFQNIGKVNGIFRGISDLYREATEQEVEQFLQSDFISLENGFSAKDVKIPNRKQIALLGDALTQMDAQKRGEMFSYFEEYFPELVTEDKKFKIATDDDLKNVLFGIDERLYTTPVGGEKRLANSVIPLHR